MVNVAKELEKLGLELTDEYKESVKKSLGDELYSKAELDKKVSKAEEERDEWKKKAETAEKDYEAKIAAREKDDLLKEAFESIKFSSESAKKTIMRDIAEGVSVKDGKLIGFNDLLEDAKKNDASAFVNEQEEQNKDNQAMFTDQMGGSGSKAITGDPNKMDFATYKKWREQNQ